MTPEMPIGRLALFLDVDGTLIDIAPRPNEVVVPPALIESLEAASQKLEGAVALVSGRSIADLDRLFHPLRLRAAGVHGAEMRLEANGGVTSSAEDALSSGTIYALQEVAAHFPGTLIEDKRYSVAIHFRATPGSGQSLHEALDRFTRSDEGRGLGILPGHMVFEIKRATFDKGVAIGTFLARSPFRDRFPVFLGDDVTDHPGFETVLAKGGYAFSVGQVHPGLSGCFPNPAAVRDWLAGLALEEARNA